MAVVWGLFGKKNNTGVLLAAASLAVLAACGEKPAAPTAQTAAPVAKPSDDAGKVRTGVTSRNDAVRAVLADQGDDGSAVRHVIHYAYPEADATAWGRDRIVADLKKRGFEARRAETNNGVVFDHHRAVAADDFDDLTDELEAWFKERGWDYDGWECAVVKPKTAQ